MVVFTVSLLGLDGWEFLLAIPRRLQAQSLFSGVSAGLNVVGKFDNLRVQFVSYCAKVYRLWSVLVDRMS